jgi:hypothetical protein
MKKKTWKHRQLENGGHLLITAETTRPDGEKDPMLELQLSMATCSINHEYARIEFDDTADRERREQLLDYMDQCRSKYVAARTKLATMSPTTVDQFEQELANQKKITLRQYDA